MCDRTKKQKRLNASKSANTETINVNFVKYNSSLLRTTSLQKNLQLMCICKKDNFQQKKYHKPHRKSVEPFRKSKVCNVQNGEANLWWIFPAYVTQYM
jgi:ABC-type lipoprotein export system ATPase subunit